MTSNGRPGNSKCIINRKDAFFGLHLDLHPTEEDTILGVDVSEENIARLLERVRPDHVAYDCKGHPGFAGYPTKVGTPSPGIRKDSLEIWRKVTWRFSVLLGIHYSGIWDFNAVRTHPEWARVDEHGHPDTEAASTFGSYVDELLIPQLKEVIDNYDIDSVWLDGECWGARLDYSETALSIWKQETGFIDAPVTREDPRWLTWKTFQRRQFEKYLCHWVDALHEYRPELNIASNWAYTTMMPKEPVARVDFISGDFDPMLSVDRARTEARYLSNLMMPWELQSWGFDLVKNQDECLKLPDHLKQEASVVLMHGGGYLLYFLPSRSGYINHTIIETAGEVADFCRARQQICHKSISVPQVALLFSAETQYDRSDKVFTWWETPLNDVEGALHAFLELHYSVDVLAEYMLQARLEEFPLVVIPDVYNLSGEFIQALVGYVYEGGKLLLLGEQCARLFKPYLGVEFLGEAHEVNTTLDTPAGKVSARGKWQDIEPVRADVIAWRYVGEGPQSRSSYMDIRESGVSVEHARFVHKHAAATMAEFGKGQIAAVYGPISSLYFNNHHPFMRSLIKQIAERIFPNPGMTVKAPACVDIALRRSTKGDLQVHLLNLSNMPVSEGRAFAEYIPRVGPIEVRMCFSEKPYKVLWEPECVQLEWTWKDGVLNVIVPLLHIHGTIIIELYSEASHGNR